MTRRAIRIGGASGYWGDSAEAPRQLIERGDIDYLVFDYLAEVTMSILVRAKAADPQMGYARDFVENVIRPLLPQIKQRGIKVIANAGGVNLATCADALRKVADEAGIDIRVGTVEGDDLLPREEELRNLGITEMFSGHSLPDRLSSANAYLGAFPIAAALDAGAEIVVTGRCVDSAVTLGACIHAFGWSARDLDKLASASMAGHIIECGAQATGGNFTDWRDTVGDWSDMGYPIAQVQANGDFVISKPEGTGGLVSCLSVGEQVLYETSDTAAYVMPDVVVDYRAMTLEQIGPDEVRVSGVKGQPPTETYKVSSTYRDGYRATAMTLITGFDAVDKAEAYAKSLLARVTSLFAARNWPDFTDCAFHLIGAGTLRGQSHLPEARSAQEVVVQIDVRHRDKSALELFSKEATGVALSMATGRCGVGPSGRPKVTPVVAQFAFLIDKGAVHPKVRIDGYEVGFKAPAVAFAPAPAPSSDLVLSRTSEPTVTRPLIDIAVARSGDKGNAANIGVMARKPEFLDVILREVTADLVQDWFAHVSKGEVKRYVAPGMNAVNFHLTECLGGGGTSSVQLDKLAKTYAQQLLEMPVEVPRSLID